MDQTTLDPAGEAGGGSRKPLRCEKEGCKEGKKDVRKEGRKERKTQRNQGRRQGKGIVRAWKTKVMMRSENGSGDEKRKRK